MVLKGKLKWKIISLFFSPARRPSQVVNHASQPILEWQELNDFLRYMDRPTNQHDKAALNTHPYKYEERVVMETFRTS